MDDCYFIDPGRSLESAERTSTQVTRRANRKKRLIVLYIVEHPNQEGDTCIDWTSQYCWTNGWNCLWRGHSVYRNRPLIPPTGGVGSVTVGAFAVVVAGEGARGYYAPLWRPWGASCHVRGMGVFPGGRTVRTVRCAKSRLFSTTGTHGSQGPGVCTLDAVLNGSCTLL